MSEHGDGPPSQSAGGACGCLSGAACGSLGALQPPERHAARVCASRPRERMLLGKPDMTLVSGDMRGDAHADLTGVAGPDSCEPSDTPSEPQELEEAMAPSCNAGAR